MFTQKRIFNIFNTCMLTFLYLLAFSVLLICRADSAEGIIILEIVGPGEFFTHTQAVSLNNQSSFIGKVRGKKGQREIIFNALLTKHPSKTKFVLQYQVELQGKPQSTRPQFQIDGQIETISGKKMNVMECGGWKVNIKVMGWVQAKNPASLANHLVNADIICRSGRVSYKGITALDSQIQYMGMVDRKEFMFNALLTRNDENKLGLTFQHSVQIRDAGNIAIFQSQGESALMPGQRKTLLKNQNCQFQVQVN